MRLLELGGLHRLGQPVGAEGAAAGTGCSSILGTLSGSTRLLPAAPGCCSANHSGSCWKTNHPPYLGGKGTSSKVAWLAAWCFPRVVGAPPQSSQSLALVEATDARTRRRAAASAAALAALAALAAMQLLQTIAKPLLLLNLWQLLQLL